MRTSPALPPYLLGGIACGTRQTARSFVARAGQHGHVYLPPLTSRHACAVWQRTQCCCCGCYYARWTTGLECAVHDASHARCAMCAAGNPPASYRNRRAALRKKQAARWCACRAYALQHTSPSSSSTTVSTASRAPCCCPLASTCFSGALRPHDSHVHHVDQELGRLRPPPAGRSRGWGERPPPAARHVTGRGAHCSTPLSASHRHTSTCRGSAPSEQCSRVCPTHCPQQQHTAPRRGRLSAPLVHCTSVFARRALAHAGHAGSGRRAAPITFYCDARRGRCPSTATATTHSRLLPDAACRSRQCPPAQREHAGALAARPPARGRCS